MRGRGAAVALLVMGAGASACRSELFAPGLGWGVEGAEKPGPRTRAQAFASLALLADEKTQLGTMAVLAVRDGKAFVLLPANYPEARVPGVTATFTGEDGATETVSGATVALQQREGIEVLAFPAPRLAIRGALVAPAGEELPRDALRVVELRKGAAPLVQDLSLSKNSVAVANARELEGSVPAPPAGRGVRVIFEAKSWRLVGLVMSGSSDARIDGAGALGFVRAAAGAPQRAVLRVEPAGERCRISAEIEVRDPLGTFLEAGLVLGEPGAPAAIPEIPDPPREPARAAAASPGDAPSPVVPVGKKLAARARPEAPGRFRLSVEAKACEETRFAQLVLLGDRERWLSWPYRLDGGASATVVVAPARDLWRVDDVAAALPLRWSGTPIPPPPAAGAAATSETCRLPFEKLDPDRVHVVATRGARGADKECANGLLVFPVDEEEKARCMQREDALIAIAADGLPVYQVPREAGWTPRALRRAVPDRNEPDADGACKLVTPRLDDDLVASSPACERPAREIFPGPDGELVFACYEAGYVRRDGRPLDLAGGALLRLGEKNTALVVLPWGMLGVLGTADGKGREVGGLPLGVRLDRPMPSAAVADGFLVALERGADAGAPELFHVAFDGTAESRGRFGPLGPDGALARHLGADGALYTLAEREGRAEGKLTRWTAGGGSEVLVDPALQAAEDRLSLRPLLLGWRSAGPAAPGPAAGRIPSSFGFHEWPEAARKEVLARWTLAAGEALPCRPSVDQLDPERVWIQAEDRIFDPADPGRVAFAGVGGAVKLAGDGGVLALSGGRIVRLPLAAEALRPKPDGTGCLPFPGGGPGPAPISEACPEPERKDRFTPRGPGPAWEPIPGQAAALLQCPPVAVAGQGAAPEPVVKLHGDHDLPAGYWIAHAGHGGRLLLRAMDGAGPGPGALPAASKPPPTWVLQPGNGRRDVAVAGLPPVAFAIRAVPDGFLVVAAGSGASRDWVKTGDPSSPQKLVLRMPALELYRVGDDGRPKKLATVPPLGEKEELLGVAVTPDENVHVLSLTEFQRPRLVRFGPPPGAATGAARRAGAAAWEPVEEWLSATEPPRFGVRLVTGP